VVVGNPAATARDPATSNHRSRCKRRGNVAANRVRDGGLRFELVRPSTAPVANSQWFFSTFDFDTITSKRKLNSKQPK
jgi:hypothetical protein